MVRRREAWIEGIRPRTLGSVIDTSRAPPDFVLSGEGIGFVNWKGYLCLLTMLFDMLTAGRDHYSDS